MDKPYIDLLLGIIGCFDSSKYSDLVIRCEAQEFKVHKIVICSQSKYFSTFCDGDWKVIPSRRSESLASSVKKPFLQETAHGVIELQEDDVRVVEAMLDFMYRFDYDCSGNALERVSPMLFDVSVYSIADKYDIPALRIRAKEKFAAAVRTCWQMDDFPSVIAEVYGSTPSSNRSLRDTVIDVTQKHIKALMEKGEFVRVLKETSEFAADVTGYMVQKGMGAGDTTARTRYSCPSCRNEWEAVLQPSITQWCVRCGQARSDWSKFRV